MATYKSVGDVIKEIEYWLRLATFLHEPLKYALLAVLHNSTNDPNYVGLPEDPIQLYQELSKHGNKITQLVKNRVLQQDQFDLLLPPNDNKTDSSKFDVTLIAILIINFTTLQPPLNGWKDKNPPAHDTCKGASVIRCRKWRNYIHHTEPKDIEQAEFNKKWAEGTQIINNLGYKYDTNKLKTISLDPKHELIRKSLFSFMARLQAKHTSLEAKHDSHSTLISDLTQQLNKIENEVKYLRSEKEKKDYSSTASTGSYCLKSVLEYISKEIKEEEAEELLTQLNVHAEGDLVDKLKSVPWKNIKTELEMLGRADTVKYITKNTLITRGLQNASDKLRDHYKIELINCLVEQPLASIEESQYIDRENNYVDVIVLPFGKVDEEYTNSDRDFLMKQNLLNNSPTEKAVDRIIEPQDEMIFMRGVAGIGKSTLIDMFTLKWAKKELNNYAMFDFAFKFTCRKLNQILTEFDNLEHLFKLLYPDIFCNMTLEDLAEVSDRVLVIVDGLDELKDIYKMDGKNLSSISQAPFLQVICDLVNPKSMKSMKNHKTIVCGRPKACEFLKNQFSDFEIKTIEVCGFSHANVQNYIHNFFNQDQTKSQKVQDTIAASYNLKVMSTVPVFLWVICNVYSEDLIKSPINTNTELYFYTCLILLRNHFQGHSGKYKNLIDIINDQDIIDVVYSLMVLSVKTYMKNQVLFTDEDIKKLKCPVHLEQTGFIVKYCQSNITESVYQFRHLILQEFLCGMYLCVTKGISPFLSNRELTSCLPTIWGIHRIIREKENENFLQFYRALLKSNDKLSNLFTKATSYFKSLSYDAFIKKSILKPPASMLLTKTLYISDDPCCREFLDSFKETRNVIFPPSIDHVEIQLSVYNDIKNISNLLEKSNIAKIHKLYIRCSTFFDENGNMDENILRLYKMTTGSSMETKITIYPYQSTSVMRCTDKNLSLYLYGLPSSYISLLDSIKMTTENFFIDIDDVLWHSAVKVFMQEITKYAIRNCKHVWFRSRADSSIKEILLRGMIDAENEYIQFL